MINLLFLFLKMRSKSNIKIIEKLINTKVYKHRFFCNYLGQSKANEPA
jgi:hypothetical protein